MIKFGYLVFSLLMIAACHKDDGDGLFHDFEGKFVIAERKNDEWQLVVLDKYGSHQITHSNMDRLDPSWISGSGSILHTVDNTTRGSLQVIDADGTMDRTIFSPNYPAVHYGYDVAALMSPDRQKLAVTLDDSVFIYSISGSWDLAKWDFIRCPQSHRNVSWSPDSRRLACTCADSLNFRRLYIYTVDDSSLLRLTSSFIPYIRSGSISWAYRSDKLALSASGDIYSIQVDGSDFRNLTHSTNFYEAEVNWSPHEDRLVYERADSTFDIVLLDWVANTTDIIFDGTGGDYIAAPRLIWMEGGRYIAFQGGIEIFEEDGLYLVDIETKNRYKLTNYPFEDFDWIGE